MKTLKCRGCGKPAFGYRQGDKVMLYCSPRCKAGTFSGIVHKAPKPDSTETERIIASLKAPMVGLDEVTAFYFPGTGTVDTGNLYEGVREVTDTRIAEYVRENVKTITRTITITLDHNGDEVSREEDEEDDEEQGDLEYVDTHDGDSDVTNKADQVSVADIKLRILGTGQYNGRSYYLIEVPGIGRLEDLA